MIFFLFFGKRSAQRSGEKSNFRKIAIRATALAPAGMMKKLKLYAQLKYGSDAQRDEARKKLDNITK